MKTKFLFRGLMVLALICSCATNQDINDTVSKINELENTHIATIDEQISRINGTITKLEEAKLDLQLLIDALQLSIDTDGDSVNTNMLALKDLEIRNDTLAVLITNLKNYVAYERSKEEDWASVTFATIEKFDSLAYIVAGVRTDYEALNDSIKKLEANFEKKLTEVETSMKAWVNTQLTESYTISVLYAKLTLLETSFQEGDTITAKKIQEVKVQLAAYNTDVTEEYKSIINDVISVNNGIIDGKIQTAVTEVNNRITTEIATITASLTEIFSRLDLIDSELLEIYGLLRKVYPTSISIISSSSVKMGFGRTKTIDFRVNPSEAKFNFDVTKDDCEIELDFLGSNTKAGYVTTPTNIKLTKVEQMYDENQQKLQGQYRAYITDQRVNRRYDDRYGLVLTVPGQSGSLVQISSSAVDVSLKVGQITSFSFKESENPKVLQENLICEVGDSVISGRINHFVEDRELLPNIVFEGEGKLVLHGAPNKSIDTLTDFSKTVVYDVIDEETKEILYSYGVNISIYTGLPVVWIETENRQAVTSKEEYLTATFKLENGGDDVSTNVQIKGRGTSSWVSSPKKSYRLKFDSKESLLGEPKDKSWVMIANYFDKTMIRNKIAYYIGELSDLDYSPRFHYVDLMFNGRYDGTYMLGDKLKISKNRVNVGDDGFLVEIDAEVLYEGGVYFRTDSLPYPVSIKDPDEINQGDENFEYIRNYFVDAERVLFSENFKDPNDGWQKYLDITSFVDWWIIHEISKNTDALAFWKSCYLNLKRGKKLKIGPIWDFDQAFGNNNGAMIYAVEGFNYIEYGNKWYKRLFEDSVFVDKVKERYEFFYGQRDNILREINTNAEYLRYSVRENENRWHTLYEFTPNVSRDVWGSYNNEVQYMKDWIIRRMDWLHNAISQLN